MLEREIEPYLYSIKSELKLTMDNFLKEIGEYKYVNSEINVVKQSIMDNKKLVLIFQEDFDRKLTEINMRNNNVNYVCDNAKINVEVFNKINFRKILRK